MAVKVTNFNGEERTLLNPAEKGRKYCKELHTGANVYTGEALSDTQLSFRSGYAKAREDSAKAFCANNGTKYQKGKKKALSNSPMQKTKPNRKKASYK